MFAHGIQVREVARQPRALRTIATAIIGLVATAPDAVAGAFPLDKPVKVTSLRDAIEKAGATGTLAPALRAIAAQANATVVVVRVAPGNDAAGTDAAVIGADAAGVKTGMQALLTAQAQIGLQPRIIGAPGLDTQPVTTALTLVGKKLRAMVYAAAIGDDIDEAAAYRENFEARELMLLWPGVTAPAPVTGISTPAPVAAVAMGARAAIDEAQGWHKTISNVALGGIDGLTAGVTFDVQDPGCDANILNAAQVTTIVRIGDAFRFWGNRTAADPTSDFTFESATRTAQILADSVAIGLVWALDKPLLPSLARDIVEKINGKFAEEKRAGRIIGAEAEFLTDKNPVEALKAGQLTISYRYTPVPPLEALGLEQEITDEFLADFATLVAA
ncbi:phage tail sheath subtilisin-like domain-containing protein [uncultured Sphingomonas sp.]|uniref:phage tail sheath subtilisin-like domain-containing protein n=1 Tax=uncultured Sphingomonas sp. TaxID=158754 RepID=UPI0025EADE24|nr:phage tail sheath subtilisin-like domain-containing protein [uncultured Sphingomonas sp.]